MDPSKSSLLEISVAEYSELLEEIRSGRASVWIAFAAYLALTGALLGVLGSAGLFAITVPIIMASLGAVIGAHIFRVRLDNNINFARVWDVESTWKSVTGNAHVGARWNPWDSHTLERTWRLPDTNRTVREGKGAPEKRTLGVIDFSLIMVVGLVMDLWAIDFLAVLEGLAAFTLSWLLYYIILAAPTMFVLLLELREIAKHEHSVIDGWKAAHPQAPKV
jgi:hypothetical protein